MEHHIIICISHLMIHHSHIRRLYIYPTIGSSSYKKEVVLWGLDGGSFLPQTSPSPKLHDGTNFVDIVILGGGVLD